MEMVKYVFLFAVCISSVFCIAAEELRLIAFDETHTKWMIMSEVETLMVNKVHFIDITDYRNVSSGGVEFVDPLPTQPQHKIYVENLIPELSIDRLQASLNILTTFYTRYYRSDTGVAAAKWIAEQFIAIAADRKDITVELFTHPAFPQPSVITTIPGVGPNKDQFVVIGAHEDSVGSTSTGRSPGADDDGTGTITVLEVFRVLVGAGHYPDRTLKFITYAAEEAGLLGSQDIANAFKSDSANVYAVLQLDMTGYGASEDIGVVTDNVDLNLTSFVKTLIDAYSLLNYVETRCGYGCSDHASWTRVGYRSAFPFETDFSRYNPYIHTANDLISHLSFDRILEFAKIGLGFVIELGGTTIRP